MEGERERKKDEILAVDLRNDAREKQSTLDRRIIQFV